ncbi:MAG: hypothetical protein J6G98_02525 [Bacilli bacterium]|nr:hypothetical protein [Bacilli bacterium]
MNEIEKVKTKEELINELKKYKTILSVEIYDYLNSLIELEFSALRNYILDSEKEILSNLEIYRQIVIYNIYKRAINILSNYESISKVGNNANSENLNAYYKGRKIYQFKYKALCLDDIEKIGSIEVFNTFESPIQREKEMNRIIDKLDRLYNERNPFGSSKKMAFQAHNWAFTHQNMIDKYERLLSEIDSKNELTDKDKEHIQISNELNILFMDDYDISFDELTEKRDMNASLMNKEYIKKLPDVNFKNKINYV